MRVPRRHLNPFPGDRSVVVLDNASVHWDDRVRRLIEREGAILLYLPAYSYDFNPIEMAFNEAKATLEVEPFMHNLRAVRPRYSARVSTLSRGGTVGALMAATAGMEQASRDSKTKRRTAKASSRAAGK